MKRRMDYNYGWETVNAAGHGTSPEENKERDRQKRNSRPSHLYLNLSLINNNLGQAGLTLPIRAFFQESRSTPLIDDASEWDFSVIRFSTAGTGTALPLFIPAIAVGQPDIDRTVYQLSIVTAQGTFAQTLFWTPEVTNRAIAPLPSAPTTQQDLSSVYYFASSYDKFSSMFNTALIEAIQAAITAGAGITPDDSKSYLAYHNEGNSNFYLNLGPSFMPTATHATANGLVQGTVPSAILQMNVPLANLLNAFDLQYLDPVNSPEYAGLALNNTWYTLVLPTNGPYAVYPPAQAPPATIISPNSSCTVSGLWNPIDAYVFTTNFLPLQPEQGSAPVVVDTGNIGASSSTQAGFVAILSDLVIPGPPEESLSATYYTPSSEYRISAMTANVPVQNVDVALFWRFRLTGELFPVYMPSGSSVSMKMLFRRKDWLSGGQ